MNVHAVLLRSECVLPAQFHPRQQPFCQGWSLAADFLVSEVDASIRAAGWHFMWIAHSHSSRALGATPEAAIGHALTRALKHVKRRFNAAEVGSVEITKFLGFRIAKVTVHTRHIQKHTSLDSAEEIRLREVLAH